MADCNLSVLVAIHNSAIYLPRLVTSLAANRIDGIEYIFVDDGSTDGGLAVLARLLHDLGIDSVSRVEQNAHSVGIGRVRQQLFDLARGRYFIYADSDDYLEDGMYLNLLRAATTTNSDLVWEDYYEEGCHTRLVCQSACHTPRAFFCNLCSGRLHGALWNKMIRKSAALTAGSCFLTGVNCCEDFYFLSRLVIAGCKITYTPSVHYHYVQHGISITHQGGVAMANSIWKMATSLEPFIPTDFKQAWSVWKRKMCCDIILDERIDDSDVVVYFPDIERVFVSDVGLIKATLFLFARAGHRKSVTKIKRSIRAVRTYLCEVFLGR